MVEKNSSKKRQYFINATIKSFFNKIVLIITKTFHNFNKITQKYSIENKTMVKIPLIFVCLALIVFIKYIFFQ